MLTGEDSEGESIDINKIDAALKTVGISLKDFLTGSKGIDDIFLELSSKWNDLDLATQRYIATTAAGSRQQSRFIAMMSNYERTMELVEAANNSAGASAKQFDKTLESLDTKLQRLKNAWDTFVMGLTNNEVIKFGVDLTTDLLEGVNGLIDGISGGNGLVKSFVTLGLTIGGLAGGKKIFDSLWENLKKGSDSTLKVSEAFGKLEERAKLFNKNSFKEIWDLDLVSFETFFDDLPDKIGEKLSKAGNSIKTFGKALGKFLISPTGFAVLGITLLIGVITAYIAVTKKNAESLENASDAANKAKTAADETAEAYNNLSNSLETIESKREALNELAKGTTEWKDAVRELNDEMISLVETYPEIRKYVGMNEDGILEFQRKDGETIEDYVSKLGSTKISAQNASLAASMEVNQKELDKIASDIATDFSVIQVKEGADSPNVLMPDDIKELATEYYKTNEPPTNITDIDDEEFRSALYNLGKSLVEFEDGIEVYTDTILKNSAELANIGDEQTDSAMNFLGAAEVDAIRQDIINNLKENPVDRADFAKQMGYHFEDDKFYNKQTGEEIKLTDYQIRIQAAGIELQKQLQEKQTKLIGFIDKLNKQSKGVGTVFEHITENADGLNLTLADLNQGFDSEKLWEKNPEVLTQIYGDKNTYDAMVKEAISQGASRLAKIEDTGRVISKNEKGLDTLSGDYQLSLKVVDDFVKKLYDTALTSSNDKAKELDEQVNGMLASLLDPEGQQLFMDALNEIDWTNIDSVEQLSEKLEKLGLISALGADNIEDLENKIAAAAKASKKVDVEKMKEAFNTMTKLLKDLRDREEGERTFTEEQMNSLISAGGATAQEFVWTGEDEFMYVGNSIDRLIVAVEKNTQATLEDILEAARIEAERAKQWEQGLTGLDTTDLSLLQKIAAGEEVSVVNANVAKLSRIATTLGMEPSEDLNHQQLVDLIKAEYEKYGSEAARNSLISRAESLTLSAEATKLYYQDSVLIAANANAENADPQLIENTDKALSAQANAAGVDAETIEVLTENLVSLGMGQEEAARAAKVHAIQMANQQKAVDKAAESMKDYIQELQDVNGDTTKMTAVYKKMQTAIKEAFGAEMSMEEVQESVKVFEAWADGSEEAVDKIKALLQDEYVEALNNLGLEGDATGQQILNALQSLPEGISIHGNFDNGGILDSIQVSENKAEELKRQLEDMGYTIEFRGIGSKNPITGTYEKYEINTIKRSSGFGRPSGSSGGGGGGGSEKWENPYDEFYNLLEKINEELLERERIERRYQKELESRKTSAAELYDLTQKELASLKAQRDMQKQLRAGRTSQIENLMKDNSDLVEYARYNFETMTIDIDWDKIEAITDSTLGEKISEYIGQMEEWQDGLDEIEKSINEIDDAVKEIASRGEEEYFDLEEKLREAILKQYEDEITRLENINNAITSANESILNKMQEQINDQRQARENDETEKDLMEKQRRLSYLQQDTSGANALEILRLQKELDEAGMDYTDSLVDQKIAEIQKQNEAAEKQRQTQIDIARAQLEAYEKSDELKNEVSNLIEEVELVASQNGVQGKFDFSDTKAFELLKYLDETQFMSYLEQIEWGHEIVDQMAQAVNYLQVGRQLEYLEINSGEKVKFKTQDGVELEGVVDEDGNVKVGDKTYRHVYQGADAGFYTQERTTDKHLTEPVEKGQKLLASKANQKIEIVQGAGSGYWPLDDNQYQDLDNKYQANPDALTFTNASKDSGWASYMKKIKAIFQNTLSPYGKNWNTSNWNSDVDWYSGYVKWRSGRFSTWSGMKSDIAYVYNAILKDMSSPTGAFIQKKRLNAYKTGGLADFTGPAWLDGTKSKPEIVLNARDTENFIQLKDILSSIMSHNFSSNNNSTENNGDTNFDIDINVESIGNDYDVEQIANKVKTLINESAYYRNNNAISLKR